MQPSSAMLKRKISANVLETSTADNSKRSENSSPSPKRLSVKLEESENKVYDL